MVRSRSAEALAAAKQGLQEAVDAGQAAGYVTLIWRPEDGASVETVGHRDVAAGLPMTRDTMFRIASMTKPITSVACLMLMEEGRLKLGDPISKWLPELADPQVLILPTAPLDATQAAGRAATVRDLLTHRAGFTYGFLASPHLRRALDQATGGNIPGGFPTGEWLTRLAGVPLAYPPGEAFNYSMATDVLGALIERVTETPYRDFVMSRIFGPLGMKDTDFWCPPEKRDRMAKLYRPDAATGELLDESFPHSEGVPVFCSAGAGLISTADDYLAFARMLLNGGEANGFRFLERETVELMTRDHLSPAEHQRTLFGFPYWRSQGFGLGVSMVVDPEAHGPMGCGSKGAFGWPGAFGTWWQADPERQMVAIYLVQHEARPGTNLVGEREPLPVFQRQIYAQLEALSPQH